MTTKDDYYERSHDDFKEWDRLSPLREDPSKAETTNYCAKHHEDYFGSCKKCRDDMNTKLLGTALGALGLEQEQWWTSLNEDEAYIESVTRDEK